MHRCTTRQAAKELGISLITLARYIAAKKIPAPKVQQFGGKFRVWTEADIERVRNLLPKIKNGRKTRYKKKQMAIGNKQVAKGKPKPKKPTVKSRRPKP